jgi:hypothetical protein
MTTETGDVTLWGRPLGGAGISYRAHHSSGRRTRYGALWIDALQQAWHLEYWLDLTHGSEIEKALLAAVDHTS